MRARLTQCGKAQRDCVDGLGGAAAESQLLGGKCVCQTTGSFAGGQLLSADGKGNKLPSKDDLHRCPPDPQICTRANPRVIPATLVLNNQLEDRYSNYRIEAILALLRAENLI